MFGNFLSKINRQQFGPTGARFVGWASQCSMPFYLAVKMPILVTQRGGPNPAVSVPHPEALTTRAGATRHSNEEPPHGAIWGKPVWVGMGEVVKRMRLQRIAATPPIELGVPVSPNWPLWGLCEAAARRGPSRIKAVPPSAPQGQGAGEGVPPHGAQGVQLYSASHQNPN